MADISDVLNVLTSIENYLVDLPTKILLKADQIYIVNGLSDVSENLGIITAGEFRAGNRLDPGKLFTGMRMAYPAMTYDLGGTDTEFHLVGINADVLQFGVNAEDGTLIAGAGAVVLSSTGIAATAGSIAGWTINSNYLGSDGTPGIKILSTGAIETSDFVSGILGKGWRISEAGDAEFNNAIIRGELRTTVLSYQEVQAVSGTMGVFQSAGVILETTGVVPAVASSLNIKVKDPEYGHTALFAVNDVIWIKDGTNATWFTITSVTDNTTYYTYACRVESGSTGNVYTAGQAIVNFGVAGEGYLLMEAIGTGAPYFSVRTASATPWTGATNIEHVRMGNLNGSWGYASAIYGVALGVYDTNLPNITIDSTNGLRIRTHTTTVIQLEADGDAFIASDLVMGANGKFLAGDAAPTTGDYVFEINNEGIKMLAIPVASWPDYTSGNVIYWESDSLTPEKVFSITSYIDGSSVRFARIEATNSRLFIRAEYPTVYGSNIYMYGDENGLTLTTKASPIVIDANGGTLGTIDLDGEVDITLTSPEVYIIGDIIQTGGMRTSGSIQFTGDLNSYKNTTAYTGYIFVPLTTPLTSTSYNGDDTIAIGSYTIDTSSVFSAPVGIKAALIYVRAKWASAGNYWFEVRTTTTTAQDAGVLRAHTTYYDDANIIVPCDANGDFAIVVGGANATNVIIHILGYFI